MRFEAFFERLRELGYTSQVGRNRCREFLGFAL